ncbi:2', 3'-cyclic nucleotide 2'-phosphodiesterase [Sulfurifustis variabilis]|uniref:2', 3'-cyclic nucleotide 2'-phosphodiesterase n=1 Tax=Sulfurifustis variabilis TaxID=1675686 RepID=A0A1B4V6T9_9GAMM|nr:DNA phosphorothioation system sulfurtransferase DndC [Sulfurifustis variabilis]BAU49165.1 2', 3'-cyclic nucleotide 2'-phosphodiesterase [Sulfurifustis variabilis]
MKGGPEIDELSAKILAIKTDIKEEYRAAHNKPWIIGFSGGKDSTLVLQLVVETLLELPWSERSRRVHVIANDTLVESPIVQTYVESLLSALSTSLPDLSLPIEIHKTTPLVDQTFWVNLIGRGYPPPTRFFRWCTDRMKIRPTTDYIRERITESGEVILLLGVRRSESTARAKSAKRYDGTGRLNPHNDLPGCFVFRPILELTTDEVWEYLFACAPPWAGSHQALMKLYRDATGGECPVVIDTDTQPSCGSNSIRFGCWTCTVVDKDKSFRNAMEKGFERLEPMANFRDWLKDFCYTEENRMTERRNGQAGLGPLKFDARKTVLDRLLALQDEVKVQLISSAEIRRIEEIWRDDASQHVLNRANRLLQLIGEGR